MNGAESLVHTLLKSGVDCCFANPGTSEMHFVAALDRIPGMRCVLGLSEGVVTGAADGYGRMADRPSVTLLHCGPGLANGLANLHNARRAQSPIVNVVGDHATYHRALDAPLTSDVEGWARPVSAWTRTSTDAATLGADAAMAVRAALTAPGQIASLILPSDTSWNEGGIVAEPQAPPAAGAPPPHIVRDVARVLRSGEPAVLLLTGRALRGPALADAHRIAAATGARLFAQQTNGRVERGLGRHPIERLPYPVDQAVAALAGTRHLILVGSARPAAFFAYPGKPGYVHPADAIVHVLTRPEQDGPAALAALADELGAAPVPVPDRARPELPGDVPITPETVACTVGALLPDNAVIVDESVSFGRSFFGMTQGAAPHDWLQITGGAIGSGLPMATGAAVAAPGRRVVSLQADGAAMYTLQALWTQARERLDVTTIILSNRRYAILLGEFANVGAVPGEVAHSMMTLGNPDLDWVAMAKGMGVEAARADTIGRLADLIAHANARKGPFLIELVI